MKIIGASVLKHIVITAAGWTLLILGILALVLPGPGLLGILAGLIILATQYEWAEHRLEPFKKVAIKAATDSVANWYRITLSTLSALIVITAGALWGLHPDTPDWWPLSEHLWLPGGWSTGGSIIASGIIALALIVYSFIVFRKTKKN